MNAKERFFEQKRQKYAQGKKDARSGIGPLGLTKAYLKGYEEGMAQKSKIIEQEWDD
jgi:hypothetical protein